MQNCVYQTKICSVDERQVIDVCVALNSRLSTWLLTTSVEDFERASIRKEDNANTTCELTILILSVTVTSSVTFVWMLPCYIFHSKSACNVDNYAYKSVCFKKQCSGKISVWWQILFYAYAQIFALWHAEKNIKIWQQLWKLQQTHTILTHSFTCRMRWVHLQGSAAT